MRNAIKEIEEFFSFAIEQIRKDDNYGMPTTKEDWIKYVDALGLQVNWILRDSDKIVSDDIEQCKDLYEKDYSDTLFDPVFYMLPVNRDGYENIHYCQYSNGQYYCILFNDDMLTGDLDELKAWINKQL